MGHAGSSKTSGLAWTAFDQSLIASEVAKGHVVFVDVTADWCITCKVNKLTVIERGDVAAALSQPGVMAMQADWTQPNETISHYLESFGRFGIPFNAVYGPKAPEGIALPELPSTEDVLNALRAAKP
jgi:suppressor for copper-sensitivity B